ncbi:MAG TPA: GxxExxY protein [Kofleriaceae bacterium]|nr:GxxExxY protein [Kofleriaceae bacterium]
MADKPEMNRQDAADAKLRELLHPEPTEELDRCANTVIGAAIDVHRALGPGFLEQVYESAMMVELQLRGIPVRRQVPLQLEYKGHRLPSMQVDLLVDDILIVELKAGESLAPIHMAQVLSYLRAGAFQLGLLINFNVPLLRQGIRRVIFSG